MSDFSTNKHYSDDAVRGWREGRRDEGRRERGEKLMGEKRERAFMCKKWCCVVIVTFLFVLVCTLLLMKTLYYLRHYR